MWSLFVLVPAMTSAAVALFSLTGGMSFVVTAVTTSELQRRRGYKPGEGHFTERANDRYYGVCFDTNSGYDLSRDLGRLGSAAPGLLNKLANKRFDLTKSDGEFLRSLMAPAMALIEDFEAVKALAVEQAGQEVIDLLIAMTDQLAAVVIPVARWLEAFPRVKVTS